MVPCRPKFRCPQPAKLYLQPRRGDDFAPAAARRSEYNNNEANECQRGLFQNCNVKSPTRCIRWLPPLRSQGARSSFAPAEAG